MNANNFYDILVIFSNFVITYREPFNKGQSQGHKVIDLGVIWKGIINGVIMHAKYEVSISYSFHKNIFEPLTHRQILLAHSLYSLYDNFY